MEASIPSTEKRNVDQTSAIFPCISCNEIFLIKEECREHMREHARNGTLKCRYCNQLQSNMKQLLHHLKAHRAKSLLQQAESEHSANLILKEKSTLEASPAERTLKKRRTGEYKGRKKGTLVYSRTCPDCGEVFSSTTTLKSHMKLHNAGKLLYSCSYCSYRSDFPTAIVKHLKKKHEDMKILYKCALCNYVAIRISLLKSHVTLNQHSDK